MAETDFKLKFDGKQHQVNVEILINSLVCTTSIIRELNKAIDPSRKIEIKVKAPQKGSFLIQLELHEILAGATELVTLENIKTAGTVLSGLVGLFKLKQHLSGKKPQSVDKTGEQAKITNTKGDIFYVENLTYNIYDKNPIVQENLTKTFETIQNEPAITAFEITNTKGKRLFKADRNEFETLSEKDDTLKEDEERITVENVKLTIARLSFEKGVLWEVYHKGNKIKARLADDHFYASIDKGENFAKGDVLQAELQTIQKWDKSINIYINKSYCISKILKHIKREKQNELFPKRASKKGIKKT